MKNVLGLTFLALAAAAAAGAAADPPPEEAVFEEASRILSVEVPVTVVGRDGQPVRGLAAGDFEVFDEDTRQTISSFQVVDLAEIVPDPVHPAAIGRRLDSLRPSERRHFLLLFDFSYSTPAAILKARLAARQFVVEELHPADLVAVATLSLEQGVRLVVTFTPDRAQLARGIDTLGARAPGESSAALDPLRFMVVDPSGLDSTSVVGGGRDGVRSDREDMVLEYLNVIGQQLDKTQRMFDRGRISSYTRVLGDLARSLDSVKGRKHVVLFSEGFESRLLLGREAGNAEEQTDAESINLGQIWQVDSDNRYGNTELQSSVQQMVEEFRRADCVIQAVDIGGLRARAEAGGAPRRSGKEALFVLANATGGELFEDANDLGEQLEHLLARSSVTYLLTFDRTDVPEDGKFHRLKVRLKDRAGSRVSHRAGYYAPRPFTEMHRFERDLLASDQIASAAANRDIDLRVLAAAFRSGAPEAYVPIVIEASGRGLVQGTPDDSLAVEVFVYVSDARGQMRDFLSQVVSLEAKNRGEALRAGGLKYYGDLVLPAGDYVVRVLVRNAETGRSGVESVRLTVPDYTRAGPSILPPFFVDPGGAWLLVREQAPVERTSVVYPFVVNGEPFVPSARAEIRRGALARVFVVAYHLGADLGRLEAVVRRGDGVVVQSGSLRIAERTATGIQDLDKLVADFDTASLPPGDYTLEVRRTDANHGSSASPTAAFTVAEEAGGISR